MHFNLVWILYRLETTMYFTTYTSPLLKHRTPLTQENKRKRSKGNAKNKKRKFNKKIFNFKVNSS